ncbi:drebrin-like protein [Melopsittacus undulatus]|uniref:drebrin-like protein n=1 Tax=Melopsittacus undulatus TaxID=13146 RepID=UPI001469EA32|nr:drebrin-like protein [Melopsittacus undulatus]
MAAPGLERHRLALLAAREDVGNPRAGTDWAVFGYEKHHELKLLDSGAGGPEELSGRFSAGSIMYGLCRVPEPGTGAPRVVLIHWVGEKVPEAQREACAGHLPVLRGFFREASAVLSAQRPQDLTRERLNQALAQVEPPGNHVTRRVSPPDTEELVGTNYRRTNPALELNRTQRDSFWAQAEREEQQRKEQERNRLREEQQRWERQRRHREHREAAERERRCRERERELQEQRKAQALLEAEERRKEKERWEQQQREHEEAMRDRGRSSESIGKAAEAAALVSQRPQNPREFFRQRERERERERSGPTPGSRSHRSPSGPRPFLRYQRSLTEAALIFRRPEPPAAPEHRERHPETPPGTDRAGASHGDRPIGTGTPPSTTSGTHISPIGTGSPTSASLGTPSMGTGTLPSATTGMPQSPTGTGTPQTVTPGTHISPIGTETPPSPARAGSPHATSPIGTGTPPSATSGTLTSPIEGGTPPSPMGAALGSPPLPSPPPAESPPPDPCPLPSPPAMGRCGPNLSLPIGPVGQELPRRDSGYNGLGGGLWAAPWERDPPPPEGPPILQGDEPNDSSIRHRDKPGFALLLTHPQLLGGSSAPPKDEELSPHAV